ncbi:MAG: hypothetical protein WKF71_13735 [Pyrinomonadaceae bacterium]
MAQRCAADIAPGFSLSAFGDASDLNGTIGDYANATAMRGGFLFRRHSARARAAPFAALFVLSGSNAAIFFTAFTPPLSLFLSCCE